MLRLKLLKPNVLLSWKAKLTKFVLTSPNEPVGLKPRARLVAAPCWAAVFVFVKPVAEAKFLKPPVVLDQAFTAAVGFVLAKARDEPSEVEETFVRVVQPVGNPLPRELKSWK